jgi:hypothetical protein
MHADANANGDRNVDANTDRNTHTCARQLRQHRYDL